jgi:hypothetical protein
MNIVTNILMGWDRKLQCPIPSGELFDFCIGFLHRHSPKDLGTSMSIGWCIPMGMPINTTRFLQLVKDPNSQFMNHFIAHQITLLQTEKPILKGAFCLDCDGFLQVLVLFIPIFKRPKQNASVPIAANCPIFKTSFTNEHLLWQTITKLATSIGIQPKTFNPIEIENFINALNLLPFPNAKSNSFKVNSIVLTLTLLRH